MPTAATGTRTISGSVAKLPFGAKSENRVLENQGLASPNFPVFGNLLQSRFLCIKAMLSQEFSVLSSEDNGAPRHVQADIILRGASPGAMTP